MTNSFQSRYKLSDIICNKIGALFNPNDVEIIPFGMESITAGNQAFAAYLNSQQANLSHSAMIVKFAPDYILLSKTQPQNIYFLEVKVSQTPLYYQARLDKLRKMHPKKDVKVSDVGDVAREAWNAYNNLFPNTIILAGSSYNPKVLMAQFVHKIDCLYCHSGTGISCGSCPVKQAGFFPLERNAGAQGSQTPHTNIDYSSFEPAESFFANLNIALDATVAEQLRQEIRDLGIAEPKFPDKSERQKIRKQLIDEGCYWLYQKDKEDSKTEADK